MPFWVLIVAGVAFIVAGRAAKGDGVGFVGTPLMLLGVALYVGGIVSVVPVP